MKNKKYLIIIFVLIIVTSVSLTGVFLSNRKDVAPSVEMIDQSKLSVGKVLGEGETPAAFKSDNFHASQIAVGGEGAVVYAQGSEQADNIINDLRSQVFLDKNKKDKKLLVSWTTSKASRCDLGYAEAGTASQKKFEESSFGYDHSILVGPLPSATTYKYDVMATDKWGNQKSSDQYAVYTGAPEVSFLDLIAGAFKDTFGWAMAK